MIKELIDAGIAEAEALQIAVEQWGFTPESAQFVLAIERGDIKGDVIEVDEEETDE